MRPLVPTVGRELVVGRAAVPVLGRVVALPLPTRPDALPVAVGRELVVPLIEPPAVRPDTVAPFCRPLVALGRRPLIEPPVPLACLTLAT